MPIPKFDFSTYKIGTRDWLFIKCSKCRGLDLLAQYTIHFMPLDDIIRIASRHEKEAHNS